jgi:hypothetical protein
MNIFILLNTKFKNSLKFLSHQKIETCNNEKKTKPLALKSVTNFFN